MKDATAATPGKVVEAITAEDVKRIAAEAVGPVVLEFVDMAGCGFCQEEAPKVAALAQKCGVTVIRADVKDEAINKLADDYKVEGLPTLLYAQSGAELTPEKVVELEDSDALKRRMNEHERLFPIQGGPAIPWRLIAPHERQAMINHARQTLQQLAARGGLSPDEAVAVLNDRPWRKEPRALEALRSILDADAYRRGYEVGLEASRKERLP